MCLFVEAHVSAISRSPGYPASDCGPVELCGSVPGAVSLSTGVVLASLHVLGMCERHVGDKAHVSVYKPGKVHLMCWVSHLTWSHMIPGDCRCSAGLAMGRTATVTRATSHPVSKRSLINTA